MLALLGLAGCRCDACQEWERGLVVALDGSRCPDVAVTGDITLCVYAADGRPVTVRSYDDPRDVASVLIPLREGHYTVAATVNVRPAEEATASLTALHRWLEAEASNRPELLSGVADAEVPAQGIGCAVIPLRQGAFSLPVLRLRLTLPDTHLPDYRPAESRNAGSRAGSDNTYIIRCVAELTRPGTDNVVLHQPVASERQADGTYLALLPAASGTYDLRLWADYAPADTPLADTHYHTDNLRAVTVVTDPYTAADAEAKDAACCTESNVALPEEGLELMLSPQRPLAGFRIVADDAEAYRRLTEADPQKYPPLEELTVTVQYEGYFPSTFNVASGRVTDALTGMAFATGLAPQADADGGLALCADRVLAGGESSVSATLTVADRSGRPVCGVSRVQIAYRQGCLTTLRGRFLTAGSGGGGIIVDTEWDDVIIIEF